MRGGSGQMGQGGQSEGSCRLCEKQGWSEVDTVGTEGEVNDLKDIAEVGPSGLADGLRVGGR